MFGLLELGSSGYACSVSEALNLVGFVRSLAEAALHETLHIWLEHGDLSCVRVNQ